MMRYSLSTHTGIIAATLLVIACTRGSEPTPEQSASDPLETVHELLRLHGLLGRQPEERSEESRKKEVGERALKRLFQDFSKRDPFLNNLYVGFVVGALARNQGRLLVTRQGNRADVVAGKVRVVLVLQDGRFKISLAETIPEQIKKRAAEEKAGFEAAKANGQGASAF